ncbi:MAG: hypothetical protein ACPIOQ_80085, partial [Promethearchaeia archaeon]
MPVPGRLNVGGKPIVQSLDQAIWTQHRAQVEQIERERERETTVVNQPHNSYQSEDDSISRANK